MKATRFFVLVLVLGLLVTLSGAAGAQGQPGEGGASAPALSNGGCVAGSSYDPACDVDHDSDTDIVDIQLTASHWGQEGVWTADGDFWSLTGNTGTVTGINFLGTTDNTALELRVNNARALRLEPNVSSPNLIGGYSGNSVTSGVVGATIGGGGASASAHRVTDDYGTVGGGWNNQAGDNAGSTSDAIHATVGGGRDNAAGAYYATVSGGRSNAASGWYTAIGGVKAT